MINCSLTSQINTCYRFYCDFNFKPNNPKTAEDVAFAVARFFQIGGVLQNYYIYNGGTNFGRTSDSPYITTSYDYDAPLDEYSLLNQPKWGHLKRLHEALKSAEKILVKQSVVQKDIETNVAVICFLSNVNDNKDATVDFQNNGSYFLPAWSVSILADCSTEVYNSAKVSIQISLKTKKPSNVSTELTWAWKAEPLTDVLRGKGSYIANQLLEQKETTVDATDYLWYMTIVGHVLLSLVT
ncbi:hypothetical protein NE237_026632 [Protea cynaroides]|uniref:beta-galactosidase n=1 Tax=Protea cynaroides TaxID=273540 RepID=A0A9Q0K1D0_9MAGN|nr:hypothetical protein NE237_026632 [Protea cynaroides]